VQSSIVERRVVLALDHATLLSDQPGGSETVTVTMTLHAGDLALIHVERLQQALTLADMLGFVRRDSQAIIRKQFGVAGASYLELTRGRGEPLDWEYAVLTAPAERAPTDTVSALIAEIQSKVAPLLDDAQVALHTLTTLAVGLQDPNGTLQRLLADLHAMTGRLQRGEGAVGRLLNNETSARDLETFLN
jgi:phospholipid/cholesterol/gamma-HCH transport system substrate-binding protein